MWTQLTQAAEDPATVTVCSSWGTGVVGGACDWKWDKETDGTSSEVDWFGHFTHTHHTPHTCGVMEGRSGCGGWGGGGVMVGFARSNLENKARMLLMRASDLMETAPV